jgi:primosomal protein N' (replication factor Y)
VLVQTAFPGHPLFRALQAHDYDAWADTLLAERRMAGFPPFTYQVLLRAEGKEESEVYSFMRRAHELANSLDQPVEVYGVVPAAMPRRAGHFLAQLLVQCNVRKPLHQFLDAWRLQLDALPTQKLRWSLDIDPLEL